ncbi:MAG: hypothetical protein JJ971_13425 [Balneolaceae bacterium]|nr:hypothetical protein [Balneolaceae bacterium]MBO6547143.1 hypothetical protein [Balneolaceae bacterium]MBO6647909.1 hypothetical protein [Balneolaceae bacterium]
MFDNMLWWRALPNAWEGLKSAGQFWANAPNMSAYEFGYGYANMQTPAVVEAGLMAIGYKGYSAGYLKPSNYQILRKPLVFRDAGLRTGLGETTFRLAVGNNPRFYPATTPLGLKIRLNWIYLKCQLVFNASPRSEGPPSEWSREAPASIYTLKFIRFKNFVRNVPL